MSHDNQSIAFQECMAHARHYSALRFALLTVFLSATGALAVGHFDLSVKLSSCIISVSCAVAGALFSFVFAAFEVMLNKAHTDANLVAAQFAPADSYFKSGYRLTQWGPVTVTMMLLYLLVAAFWIIVLCGWK